MHFKKTLLAMMMFGAAAAQADYQVEIGASYSSTSEEYEYDDSQYDYDVDTDTLAAGATFYFSPVSTGNGPLAQAAFLSKASGIAVGYANGEADYDFDRGNFVDQSYDFDAVSIGGHFVLPSPNLILEASYAEGENEFENDFDAFTIGVGGYITDRITLMAEFSKQTFDDASDEDSIDIFTITYRQLIQLGGAMNLAIAPHLSRVEYFGEDAAEVGIDVAFYLNPSLGFVAGVTGGAVDDEDGDYSRAESYIGVDYFVNENFQVGGKLLAITSEFDSDDYYYNDDSESEGGGIEFNAAVRF
jgi:hypothetical protein